VCVCAGGWVGYVLCGCLDNVHSLYLFGLPWLRFFRAFSSVVRQMLGYTSQRRGTANTLPNLLFVLFCLLFMLFCCYLWCSMYCLCVNVYCHRVSTQFQLTNISIYIYIYIYISIKSTEKNFTFHSVESNQFSAPSGTLRNTTREHKYLYFLIRMFSSPLEDTPGRKGIRVAD
jgi:hypothetical protein